MKVKPPVSNSSLTPIYLIGGYLGVVFTCALVLLSKIHLVPLDTKEATTLGLGLPALLGTLFLKIIPMMQDGAKSRSALNQMLEKALPIAQDLMEGELDTNELIESLTDLASTKTERPLASTKTERPLASTNQIDQANEKVDAGELRSATIARLAFYGTSNARMVANELGVGVMQMEAWLGDPQFKEELAEQTTHVTGVLRL